MKIVTTVGGRQMAVTKDFLRSAVNQGDRISLQIDGARASASMTGKVTLTSESGDVQEFALSNASGGELSAMVNGLYHVPTRSRAAKEAAAQGNADAGQGDQDGQDPGAEADDKEDSLRPQTAEEAGDSTVDVQPDSPPLG